MKLGLAACVFGTCVGCHNVWRTPCEVAQEIAGADMRAVEAVLLTQRDVFDIRATDRGTLFRIRSPLPEIKEEGYAVRVSLHA